LSTVNDTELFSHCIIFINFITSPSKTKTDRKGIILNIIKYYVTDISILIQLHKNGMETVDVTPLRKL